MVIYEYKCGSCKRKFEKLYSQSTYQATPDCPHCGAVKAGQRQFGCNFKITPRDRDEAKVDDWVNDTGKFKPKAPTKYFT